MYYWAEYIAATTVSIYGYRVGIYTQADIVFTFIRLSESDCGESLI